jgi:hypothetical protein
LEASLLSAATFARNSQTNPEHSIATLVNTTPQRANLFVQRLSTVLFLIPEQACSTFSAGNFGYHWDGVWNTGFWTWGVGICLVNKVVIDTNN